VLMGRRPAKRDADASDDSASAINLFNPSRCLGTTGSGQGAVRFPTFRRARKQVGILAQALGLTVRPADQASGLRLVLLNSSDQLRFAANKRPDLPAVESDYAVSLRLSALSVVTKA
jgi:hypothetical protein